MILTAFLSRNLGRAAPMALASAQELPRAGGQVEVAAFGPIQGRRLTATQHMADQVRQSLVEG